MYWNANGIIGAKQEFLETFKRNEVVIALINETHLTPGQKFKISNHQVYRADRPTRGGGTAIIVNRNIQHFEINLPPLTSIEANAVIIKTAAGNLRLISVYKQPQTDLNTADLDSIFSDQIPTILAGDLNCKHPDWNSRITNKNGRLLQNHCSNSHYSIVGPDTPTIYPFNSTRPDVLDIVLFNNLTSPFSLEVLSELSSDHNPVLLGYGIAPVIESQTDKIDTNKTDWNLFQSALDTIIITGNPIIETKTDVDTHIGFFTNAIVTALKNSTPEASKKPRKIFELPANILNLIKTKNSIRKRWQAYRNPNTKTLLNNLTKEIKDKISMYRTMQWDHTVESLETQDLSLWRMTKALLKIPDKCPPLHGKHGMAYSNEDKANAMADTLEETFTPNDNPSNIDKIEEVERAVYLLKHMQTPIMDMTLCSPKEVLSIINTLNNKKAPGLDGIPNLALKRLSRKGATYITKIFNSMFKLQYYSINFKKSKIILFSKPGKDSKFPQNHRPISLLCGISKIFERIILTRLNKHLVENKILRNEQFGFRQKHSTNHQLLRITENIIEGFNKNEVTGIVFLDIAQAFDKVWHDGLIHKLIMYKFPPYLIHLIKSYLTDRSFEVHLSNKISTTRAIEAGVPQGSVLGPTLFNIFINDMPDSPHVEVALYADDTALIARSLRGQQASLYLQNALDTLEEWYEDWRIKINVSKSTATLFHKKKQTYGKNSAIKTLPIHLFNEIIPWSPQSKYLGVIMDSKLNWTKHIKDLAKRTNQRIGMLSPLINKNSKLGVHKGVTIYKSLILPLMTYASPVWAGTANLKSLQIIQNTFLRRITKDPWYIRNDDIRKDLNILTFRKHVQKLSEKFFNSLSQIPNPLIKTLGDYDENEITFYNHKRPRTILNNLI